MLHRRGRPSFSVRLATPLVYPCTQRAAQRPVDTHFGQHAPGPWWIFSSALQIVAPQKAPLQCAGALSFGVLRPSYQAPACSLVIAFSEGMTWSGAVHTGQQLPSCLAVKGAWHSSSPHVTPLQKAGSFLSSFRALAPNARHRRAKPLAIFLARPQRAGLGRVFQSLAIL